MEAAQQSTPAPDFPPEGVPAAEEMDADGAAEQPRPKKPKHGRGTAVDSAVKKEGAAADKLKKLQEVLAGLHASGSTASKHVKRIEAISVKVQAAERELQAARAACVEAKKLQAEKEAAALVSESNIK